MEFNFAEFKVVFFKDSVEIRKVHFFKNSFNKSIITLFLLLPIAIGYNYLFPSKNNLIIFYILISILIILALILNLFLMYSFRIVIKDSLIEIRKFKNVETIKSIEFLYTENELISLTTLAYGVRSQYTLFVKNKPYVRTELIYFTENNSRGTSKNSETLRQVCNLINEKFNLKANPKS